MKTGWLRIVVALFCVGCSQGPSPSAGLETPGTNELYSARGVERAVRFSGVYQTVFHQVDEVRRLQPWLLQGQVRSTLRYLYGPLVERRWGSPQKGELIDVRGENARIENGWVVVPYTYSGTWLLDESVARAQTLELPVPISEDALQTAHWLNCTDSSPEHQTWSFFWYFWDPDRNGCDHQEGREYRRLRVELGAVTTPTKLSFPEYTRLVHATPSGPELRMTFAFGYVEENPRPQPFRDADPGMREFQIFNRDVRATLTRAGFRETSLRAVDYGETGSSPIGARYTGNWNGLSIRVTVVAAAGVDQMRLFAESFAADHEGFFGWFGHSRVGSGFDAAHFNEMLSAQPSRFSITPDYQIIDWAGCNSYSYYTLPFFDLKGGTRNLDILSNGLPSYFSLNAINARIAFNALMNFQNPTSYQSWVNEIEARASEVGTRVLINVLGDEDNPTSPR